MTSGPTRRHWWFAFVATLLGFVTVVAATFWSAVDYNAYEDRFGEGETGPIPLGILLTGAIGIALLALGALWLAALLALRSRHGHSLGPQ